MITLLALINITIKLINCVSIQNNYANVDLIVEIAEAQKVDGKEAFSIIFVIFPIEIIVLVKCDHILHAFNCDSKLYDL